MLIFSIVPSCWRCAAYRMQSVAGRLRHRSVPRLYAQSESLISISHSVHAGAESLLSTDSLESVFQHKLVAETFWGLRRSQCGARPRQRLQRRAGC